jgi:hypothetical protein
LTVCNRSYRMNFVSFLSFCRSPWFTGSQNSNSSLLWSFHNRTLFAVLKPFKCNSSLPVFYVSCKTLNDYLPRSGNSGVWRSWHLCGSFLVFSFLVKNTNFENWLYLRRPKRRVLTKNYATEKVE